MRVLKGFKTFLSEDAGISTNVYALLLVLVGAVISAVAIGLGS